MRKLLPYLLLFCLLAFSGCGDKESTEKLFLTKVSVTGPPGNSYMGYMMDYKNGLLDQCYPFVSHEYDGNGRLVKVVGYDVETLTYDASGRLVSSLVQDKMTYNNLPGGNDSRLFTYSYDAGGKISAIAVGPLSNQRAFNQISLTYDGDNVTRCDWTWQEPSSGSKVDMFYAEVSYDDKINPLKGIGSIASEEYYYSPLQYFMSPEARFISYLSANNPARVKITDLRQRPGGFNPGVTNDLSMDKPISYKYDSHGYPIEINTDGVIQKLEYSLLPPGQ